MKLNQLYPFLNIQSIEKSRHSFLRSLLESFNMSLIYLTLALIVTIFYGMVSSASTQPIKNGSKLNKTQKQKSIMKEKKSFIQEKIKAKANLEQKLIFNDRLVNGKHQAPGEGIVTVENEKPLLNLLSLRTDFKDRREKEKGRD